MGRMVLFLVSCLLAQAFSVPAGNRRPGNRHRPLRADSGFDDSDGDENKGGIYSTSTSTTTSSYDIDDDDDDDDDDDFDLKQTSSSTGGGSNFMSLLNLATALFPSASGATLETMIRRVIRDYFVRNPVMLRRQDVADNVIEIDYVNGLTPPFQRQEDENSADTNESDDSDGDEDDDSSDSAEKDNAAEESIEENNNTGNGNAPKQDSGLIDDDDSDYSDEPPGGGDGQGGGVLGLLAGLSGGEDGQSDLGSLLAAVSGIVGSLSGDGIDLNALIVSGIGLFVGLLSEGEDNPGSVIASYLLTSLDTITGGGSKNNGAFFGNFLSKLVKGTSAVSDESGSSEDDDGNKMKMADSGGFIISLLMSLSGDMSKGSSGGSSAWR